MSDPQRRLGCEYKLASLFSLPPLYLSLGWDSDYSWERPIPDLLSGALFYSLLPNANDCAVHRQGTYVVQKLVEKSQPNEVGSC